MISKEKDCIVRLKKPIFVKKGNYSELTLTFPPTSLIDDILLIKGKFGLKFKLDFRREISFFKEKSKNN